jgi:periplasmic divalent cation tolerance protein
MPDLVIVLTTMPDDARADELARTLVDERLAACVNVHGPMMSTYRWKSSVERDAERQLVIKTTRDRVAALEARLRLLHPYELPEFVVIGVEGGSDAYLRWIEDETRPVNDAL